MGGHHCCDVLSSCCQQSNGPTSTRREGCRQAPLCVWLIEERGGDRSHANRRGLFHHHFYECSRLHRQPSVPLRSSLPAACRFARRPSRCKPRREGSHRTYLP